MNKRIINRVLEESEYIIKTGETEREMSTVFKVSKRTVHKDLSSRLLEIDEELYQKVSKILEYHINVRHLRGGASTRAKFLEKNAN